ncbi:UNVERIFIED_CONTAM: hypothetical protein HDU68_003116 [Siphonaria sp. JEL0065]|nr:hypothetical protein HDU68_003116 [Siphonaria sp. JEL0065]
MSHIRPAWSRNNIPTFSRFASPLFFGFPATRSAGNIVQIASKPIQVEEEYLLVEVEQRLETVNCVWDAATALCGYLVSQGEDILRKCIDFRKITDLSGPFYVLEIGSGCGLVGVVAGKALEAAAQRLDSSFHVHVVMTDLTDEVQVLQKTIEANFKGKTHHVLAEPLPWGSNPDFETLKAKYTHNNTHFIHGTRLALASNLAKTKGHENVNKQPQMVSPILQRDCDDFVTAQSAALTDWPRFDKGYTYRSRLDISGFPNSRPFVAPGTTSCSLSAKTILQAVLALPDYIVWDGEDIDSVIQKCMDHLSMFEDRVTISKRREKSWTIQFGADSWNSPTLIPPTSLNNEEIELLAECAPYNENWKELRLKFNREERVAESLSTMGRNFGICQNLAILDLMNQDLGDDAISNLATGFASTPTAPLKTLNLRKNSISNKGVIVLFTMLQTVAVDALDISYNLFDDSSSTFLSMTIKRTHLTRLDISHNKFVRLFPGSVMESKLSQLSVGHTDCLLGDEYMQSLPTGKLKSLSVQSCNVSEVGISFLETNSSLQELDLSENILLQNRVTMASLRNALDGGVSGGEGGLFPMLIEGIVAGGKVEELYIKGCALDTDNFMAGTHLLMSQIVTLDVSDNPIEHRGFIHLQQVVAQSSKFVELCLSNCAMVDSEIYETFGMLPNVSLWGISVDGIGL